MPSANTAVAIIPARAGSKGIPDKNIRPFAGSSLLVRAIEACLQSSVFQSVIVSTESRSIADLAIRAGAHVPFLRSVELAQDETPVRDVLIETVRRLEDAGEKIGIVTLVEPTCPLRAAADLTEAVHKLVETEADSVVTVSPIPTQFHPDKAMVISTSGSLQFFTSAGAMITHRQQLTSTLYYRNGAAYAVRRNTLVEKRTLYGARCIPIVIDRPLVSIDTMEDFEWAEFLLRRPEGNARV